MPLEHVIHPTLDDEAMLNDVLNVYCQWLNLWTARDKHPHEYRIEQFTTWDPDDDLFGSFHVHAILCPSSESGAFIRATMIVSVSDGDEGGDTDLIAVFEGYKADGEYGAFVFDDAQVWKLIYLVQGFDTYLQEIYNLTIAHPGQLPFIHTPKEQDE